MEKTFVTPDGETFTLYELKKVSEADELEALEDASFDEEVYMTYFCCKMKRIL